MSSEKLNLLGIPVDAPAILGVYDAGDLPFVVPTTDRILMSESLRDEIPEVNEAADSHIITIINSSIDEEPTSTVGTLRGIMYDADGVELEIKTGIDDAMMYVNNSDRAIAVFQFEFHRGEDVTSFGEPHGYTVTGCRMLDIDYARKLTTLLLQLKPVVA